MHDAIYPIGIGLLQEGGGNLGKKAFQKLGLKSTSKYLENVNKDLQLYLAYNSGKQTSIVGGFNSKSKNTC